jgi:hypothetical protein
MNKDRNYSYRDACEMTVNIKRLKEVSLTIFIPS